MRFEWDELKNASNHGTHGLDFEDAWEIFEGPILTALDDRQEYGEDRWIGIGFLWDLVVVVVFAEPEEEVIRIISLRKATSHERTRFAQALQKRLGPSNGADG